MIGEQNFYSEKIENNTEKPIQIAENVFLDKDKKQIEVVDENWVVCFDFSGTKPILISQHNEGSDRYETKLPAKTIEFLLNKASAAFDSYRANQQAQMQGAQKKIDEEAMRIFGRPYNELSEAEMEKLANYA